MKSEAICSLETTGSSIGRRRGRRPRDEVRNE